MSRLRHEGIICLVAALGTMLSGCGAGTAAPAAQGEVGPGGATGARGERGERGETGAMGEQGLTGADGPRGITGATGGPGPTGGQGATGPAGANGTDGAEGPAGSSGSSSLVALTTLPTNHSNCERGGVRIDVGLDDDGDGVLDAAEIEQTSFLCQPVPRKRVAFVTSQAWDGNLGGVAGADAKCQAAADAVPELAGKTFRAWISDSQTSPAARFTTDGMFVTVGGAVIAESIADLRDTVLLTRFTTEYGTSLTTRVWTGTTENGEAHVLTCGDWTENASETYGVWASTYVTTWYWSFWDQGTCNELGSLYCFEQ